VEKKKKRFSGKSGIFEKLGLFSPPRIHKAAKDKGNKGIPCGKEYDEAFFFLEILVCAVLDSAKVGTE